MKNKQVIQFALLYVFLFGFLGCTKSETPPAQSTSPAPSQQAVPSSPVVEAPSVEQKPARVVVATLKDPKQQVELRRLDALVWEPVQDGVVLYNRDSIRTGADSTGRVEFTDHSYLYLEEKSTITITEHQKVDNVSKSVVNLPNGSLRGEIDEKSSEPVEMTIRTKRGWVKVANQDQQGKKRAASFKAAVKPNGDTEISVEKGQAVFLTKEKEQELNVGNKLALKGQPEDVNASWDTLPEVATTKETSKVISKAKSSSSIEDDKFSILRPKNKAEIHSDHVLLEGIAGKNINVILNGQAVKVNEAHQFSTSVDLKPGVNLFVFQIVNSKTNAITYQNLEISRK